MTKEFETVLRFLMKYFTDLADIGQVMKYLKIWMNCAEEVYGKTSMQYLESCVRY